MFAAVGTGGKRVGKGCVECVAVAYLVRQQDVAWRYCAGRCASRVVAICLVVRVTAVHNTVAAHALVHATSPARDSVRVWRGALLEEKRFALFVVLLTVRDRCTGLVTTTMQSDIHSWLTSDVPHSRCLTLNLVINDRKPCD